MPEYNPNKTETLGIEFSPVGNATEVINSQGYGVAMRVPSLAAETINQVQMVIGPVTVAGTYILDIYPEANLPDLGVASGVVYNPNEDVGITNMGGSPSNPFNWYLNLDEGVDTYDRGDYIDVTTEWTSGGSTPSYEHRVASAAYSGRPIYVRARCVVWNGSTHDLFVCYPSLIIGGVEYPYATADALQVAHLGVGQTAQNWGLWNKNPATNAPWTVANIQAFDSTYNIRWTHNEGYYWYNLNRILAVDMVVGSAPEKRVATGVITLPISSGPLWTTIPVTAIAGGNWSKANATNYVYVLRLQSANGSASLPGLNVDPTTPITGFKGYRASLTEQKPSLLTDQSRWYGLVVRTTTPAVSADSQVYWGLVEEPVYNGGPAVTTEFTGVAKTYGPVTLMVKYSGVPSGPLLVKLKRRSDNVQLGATITINKSDVDALPNLGAGWRRIKMQMGSTATLAAVQYYWEYTSTSATANGTWFVANLNSSPGINQLTFGGTTDRATRAGTESDDYDIQTMTATVPTAVSGLAAALANQTVASDASEGTLNTIQYANLTWTATSLAGLFGYYEIHRTEDGGTTWYPIAKITLEADTNFQDFEGERGSLCGYRIRVVRADGAFSNWSATQSVTPAVMPPDVWSFVSNEFSSLNCIHKKLAGMDFTFPESDETEYHPVFGRDYVVALSPTENRGVAFDVPLIISTLRSFNQGANTLGWAVFNRLRNLARAATSYVCVHDPYENRILADIRVPSGSFSSDAGVWIAVVSVRQITDTFSTPVA